MEDNINNYNTNYKIIDSSLLITFSNKTTLEIFENIITEEDINNTRITKFIKFFDKCISSLTNYVVIIKKNEDFLDIELIYSIDEIDIKYNINLPKKYNTETTTKKKIISFGKLYHLTSRNYKMLNIEHQYIRYPTDTEQIDLIIPQETRDKITEIIDTYELKLDYSLDPVEIFTNLKRIKLTRLNDLLYFCSNFDYIYSQNEKYNLVYILYNNTLEEIDLSLNNLQCPLSHIINLTKRIEMKSNGGKNDLDDIKHKYSVYPYYYNIPRELITYNEHIDCNYNAKFIWSFPNLKKIIFASLFESDLVNVIELIERSPHLNFIKFLRLTKQNSSLKNYINELKEYCELNRINLKIDEIIYI